MLTRLDKSCFRPFIVIKELASLLAHRWWLILHWSMLEIWASFWLFMITWLASCIEGSFLLMEPLVICIISHLVLSILQLFNHTWILASFLYFCNQFRGSHFFQDLLSMMELWFLMLWKILSMLGFQINRLAWGSYYVWKLWSLIWSKEAYVSSLDVRIKISLILSKWHDILSVLLDEIKFGLFKRAVILKVSSSFTFLIHSVNHLGHCISSWVLGWLT